ncbi:MAG: aldo/keto reductase [Acidimicrobiales bacterium]
MGDRGPASPPQADRRATRVQPVETGRVEIEYGDLYDDLGIGTTILESLASRILTGKYTDGIPDDSRAATANLDFLSNRLTDAELLAKVDQLAPIAKDLGCTQAQLALAWCTLNPNVSSVITGASRVSQVFENFETLAVADAISDEQRAQIEAIFPV